MKKKMLAVISICLLLGMLAACQSKDTSENTNQPDEPVSDESDTPGASESGNSNGAEQPQSDEPSADDSEPQSDEPSAGDSEPQPGEVDLSQYIFDETPDVSSIAEGTEDNPAQFGEWVQVTLDLSIVQEDGSYEDGYTPIYYRITGMSEPLTTEEMDQYIQQITAYEASDVDIDYMEDWREPFMDCYPRRIDYEVYVPKTDFEADYGNAYDVEFFNVTVEGDFAFGVVNVSPSDAIRDAISESYPNGGFLIRYQSVGYYDDNPETSDYAPYLKLLWYDSSTGEDSDRYFARP